MNGVSASDVRTFAFMGHSSSGKTTLTDALLFKLGMNDRLGSVDAGTSLSDFGDEEKARKISTFAKPFGAPYKRPDGGTSWMVFVDTPGYADFHGQVVAACRAVETGVICVNATAGVQVGARRAWQVAEKNGLARAIVVTGLDRENADFGKTLAALREAFGSECAAVTLPTAGNAGVVNLLGNGNVPADMTAEVEEARAMLMERAAETDDALIEKYLGGELLTDDELDRGLKAAVAGGKLVPVFACAALKDVGVSEFLAGAARVFPSPLTGRPKADLEGAAIAPSEGDPAVGFVWRSLNDPFVGQLTFVRVLSGIFTADTELTNTSKNQKERVGGLLLANGKKQEPVAKAGPGSIVAIPKLKLTAVGDTLCGGGRATICPPLDLPKPVAFQAVFAKTQADEDKIGAALARLCEEDPTLGVERNKATKEMVLQGLGDVHIEAAVERMKNRSHVDVTLSVPKVPYRETVSGRGEGHYKHKKQTGGRGQYAEVYLRVQPLPSGDDEWFENAIVGGVIPFNFVPAVQKGVAEGLHGGPLAGYPAENIKVTVYDGSYHDVDSSEIAFKIASSRALKEAILAAKPVLLEPIMTVKVAIPDHYMGEINSDLNHKRGRILGVEVEGSTQTITAEVPQAELFRYAAELRSMTAGQGSFELEFARYDMVPSNVAQRVVAEAQKDRKEEEE